MSERAESFWQWSLGHYDENGSAPVLLHLQDEHGLNVNIALWCCWRAANGAEIPDAVMKAAIEEASRWNETVTSPLRSARRALKVSQNSPPRDVEALRQQIKDAELAAEKIEQDRLQILAEKTPESSKTDDAAALALRNLGVYVRLAGADENSGPASSLLESLIGHIFGRSDGVEMNRKYS